MQKNMFPITVIPFYWGLCWILLRAPPFDARLWEKKSSQLFSNTLRVFCVWKVCACLRARFSISRWEGAAGLTLDVFRARRMNTNAHVHFPHIRVVFPRTKIQKNYTRHNKKRRFSHTLASALHDLAKKVFPPLFFSSGSLTAFAWKSRERLFCARKKYGKSRSISFFFLKGHLFLSLVAAFLFGA